MLVFTAFEISDSSDTASKTTGWVILAIYIILPLFFALLLLMMADRLDKPESRQKIGKLFEGLNTAKIDKKRPLAWLYYPLFLARRCAFAAITVYLLDYPNLQVIVHFVISHLYVTAMSSQTNLFADKAMRNTEIFSEVMNLFGLLLLQ